MAPVNLDNVDGTFGYSILSFREDDAYRSF